MTISQGTENVTFDKEDRTWRIELFIDDAGVVQLIFHRELLYKIGGIIQHRKPLPPVRRVQAQVAVKTYTTAAGGKTGNQILALVDKMADDERVVDIG